MNAIAAYLAAPPGLDGSLSASYGFLPPTLVPRLSGTHEAWEQAAAALPGMAFSNRAQSVLDDLPVLPAGPGHLPDHEVKRAATILGVLAHAYWRFGLDNFYQPRNANVSARLPDGIRRPWEVVCRRLGRDATGMTFEDLSFNNMAFRDPSLVTAGGGYRLSDVHIGQLTLAVPAYGNATERTFLCVAIEVHAVLTPAVAAVCRLETDLVRELATITACVRAAVRAFRKISPDPRSNSYCDPVEWAKTVGAFTVPAPGYPVGPSGSATPIVHFVDALIGRRDYESDLGAFVARLGRSQLPRKHREFCELIRNLDVRGRVLACGDPEAADAFNDLVDAFAGPEGFLGVHKARVVDFLAVATLVGRNQSTAHHQTYVSERTWLGLADALHITMADREVRAVPPSQTSSMSGKARCRRGGVR